MKTVAAFFLVLLSTTPAFATFSIVAFDPRTGDLGVAVASNKEKALAAIRRAMELDPNGYKSTLDGALSNPATAAYRKVQEDKAFMSQLPQ